MRHISKSHCNKPVGPKTTKENNKDTKKTSTDIVLYNFNSTMKNNSKIKESETLQPPVLHWGRESPIYTSYGRPFVSYGNFLLTICCHMVTFTVSRLPYDTISHHSS